MTTKPLWLIQSLNRTTGTYQTVAGRANIETAMSALDTYGATHLQLRLLHPDGSIALYREVLDARNPNSFFDIIP